MDRTVCHHNNPPEDCEECKVEVMRGKTIWGAEGLVLNCADAWVKFRDSGNGGLVMYSNMLSNAVYNLRKVRGGGK